MTTSSGTSAANPVVNTWLGTGCDQANVGWPCDRELEKLRTQFAFARTNDERLELARRQAAEAGDFDHEVVNDDVERAVAELDAVLSRALAA